MARNRFAVRASLLRDHVPDNPFTVMRGNPVDDDAESSNDDQSGFHCPACGGRPGRIFICNHCGEVRCGSTACTGSKGGHAWWAGAGVQCRHCGRGKYSPIGSLQDLDAAIKKMTKKKTS
ncbi:MAG: hypothetical protein HQL82_15780 [Magnetococcales bacterium]|nr:hypothetical protein [Magnetococcales bacterium]